MPMSRAAQDRAPLESPGLASLPAACSQQQTGTCTGRTGWHELQVSKAEGWAQGLFLTASWQDRPQGSCCRDGSVGLQISMATSAEKAAIPERFYKAALNAIALIADFTIEKFLQSFCKQR